MARTWQKPPSDEIFEHSGCLGREKKINQYDPEGAKIVMGLSSYTYSYTYRGDMDGVETLRQEQIPARTEWTLAKYEW